MPSTGGYAPPSAGAAPSSYASAAVPTSLGRFQSWENPELVAPAAATANVYGGGHHGHSHDARGACSSSAGHDSNGHGHSHDSFGHGHSHDSSGHGHSHDDAGHDHSHAAPYYPAAPPSVGSNGGTSY